MSKTSETLFPGEYSKTLQTQNLNNLVRGSSFLSEAIELANELKRTCKFSFYFGEELDNMTNLFSVCNDYETRYQAIIKKALDEALAKVRAKNDANSIAHDFIPDYDLDEKTEAD